jgi:hypothetical protein
MVDLNFFLHFTSKIIDVLNFAFNHYKKMASADWGGLSSSKSHGFKRT